VKHHVHPPKDVERWAETCMGIIRHYNEGWAHGTRHGIQYWEIWNEPENRPAMWSGSDADYFRLYAATVTRIKASFPALKVGGPFRGCSG
jgi:xylan 1,4-beta-xylosidase